MWEQIFEDAADATERKRQRTGCVRPSGPLAIERWEPCGHGYMPKDLEENTEEEDPEEDLPQDEEVGDARAPAPRRIQFGAVWADAARRRVPKAFEAASASSKNMPVPVEPASPSEPRASRAASASTGGARCAAASVEEQEPRPRGVLFQKCTDVRLSHLLAGILRYDTHDQVDEEGWVPVRQICSDLRVNLHPLRLHADANDVLRVANASSGTKGRRFETQSKNNIAVIRAFYKYKSDEPAPHMYTYKDKTRHGKGKGKRRQAGRRQ